MAHIAELPAIWKDELLTTSTGPIIPFIQLIVNTRYVTAFDSAGNPTWSTDYALIEQDFSDRLSDAPITISSTKPILPDDGKRDNIVQVSEVQFTLLNADEAFAAIQRGAQFDPAQVEQIRVVIGAFVGSATVPIPLFQGRVTGLPTERRGETVFTARPNIYDALRSPVLFEKFNPLKQYARIESNTLSFGTYTTLAGIDVYEGTIYFNELGSETITLENSEKDSIKLYSVIVKNRAQLGEYTLKFDSPTTWTLSHPNSSPISGDIATGIDTDYITILPEFFIVNIQGSVRITDVGAGAGTDSINITVFDYTGATVNLGTYIYPAGSLTESEIASSLCNVINSGPSGYTCTTVGDTIFITPPDNLVSHLDSTITATITGSVFTPDVNQFGIEGESIGKEIKWRVLSPYVGNPVSIAANYIEKGILNNWGDEPTRPATVPVDWSTFENLETYFNDFKIFADFTNLSNDVFERRLGNYPLNTLVAAQKCLDHVGCRIVVDTFGVIRCVGPGVIDQDVYEISDGSTAPAIINCEILGRVRENYITFQYGGNQLNNSIGSTLIYDDSNGREIVTGFVNLPFFKSGKSEDNIETISLIYMDSIIRPNGRFRIELKPNWGLTLVPGDRLVLRTNEQPRFIGFVEVYSVNKSIGEVVTIECHEISTSATGDCARYDVDRYNVGLYC